MGAGKAVLLGLGSGSSRGAGEAGIVAPLGGHLQQGIIGIEAVLDLRSASKLLDNL